MSPRQRSTMRAMSWRRVVVSLTVVPVLVTGCTGDAKDSPTKRATTTTAVRAKPPSSAARTIVDQLTVEPDLSTLNSLIAGTELATALDAKTLYTFFAPSNEAFAALGAGEVDAIRADPGRTKLKAMVVSGKLTAIDLLRRNGQAVVSLGGPLAVTLDGNILKVGGVPVTRTDVLVSNGVIHIVGGTPTSTP